MGQFASKEYDGDPYVDLMRALPERELIWWVQKAIWVSAGTTKSWCMLLDRHSIQLAAYQLQCATTIQAEAHSTAACQVYQGPRLCLITTAAPNC